MRSVISFFILAALLALSINAQAENGFGPRTYTGYVERWRSMDTFRYVLMHKNGEAIVYIGDDYPQDLGDPQKLETRSCLNEAVATGAKVEISGQWIKLPEGAEGFDEKTLTCKLIID